MKIFTLLTCLLLSITSFGQTLDGAYLTNSSGKNTLWLFKNGYSSQIIYQNDQYIATQGGPYTFDGKNLVVTLEYNDADGNTIGTQRTYSSVLKDNQLVVDNTPYVKQPPVKQNLDGLWRITGRQDSEGQIQTIPKRDRKTIKILVDGYFQWIAINPAEKGFYGTGGGKYTYDKKAYTEHILFFSRDNTRVGNSLAFSGEVKSKEWHHSGLSSKGDPIYEIWTLE